MIVYAFTIFLTTITSFITQYIQEAKKNKAGSIFFAIATGFILVFVAGFRWYVGTDYANYANAYESYKAEVWDTIINFEEPGIRIIASLSEYIYDDYATMFLLASLITIGLFVYIIYKYSNSFFVSILLFIFGHGWSESFNGIRQMLASAIIFAGHRFIIEKDFKKYLLIILLASSFHISALPMILLYFIPQTKVTLKKALVLLLVIFVGLNTYEYLFAIINFVTGLFGESLEMTDYLTQEVNILRILVMMAPPALYLLITPKENLSKPDNFYINMLFINAAIYMMSINSAYLARFALYTIPYVTIGLPIILKNSKKSTSIMIMYVALILYLMFWIYDVSTVESLYNFQWIFER